VRIADGSWRRLTKTLMASEIPAGFTADGHMVIVSSTVRNQIMKVEVADLLGGAAREKP